MSWNKTGAHDSRSLQQALGGMKTSSFYAAFVRRGAILATILRLAFSASRSSYDDCIFIQNCAVLPKYLASRIAVSAVRTSFEDNVIQTWASQLQFFCQGINA